MGQRFLVVGGDAAGMSAASKAKRDAPDLDVVVLERGDWASYGACGLPYYVEGVIGHLDDLVVVGPEAVERRGIDLRRRHEVVDVDADAGTVTVDGSDGRYEESYDDLLLATGGRGTPPSAPGADLDGVFTVRNLEAGRALRDYIHPARPDGAPGIEAHEGDGLLAHLEDRDPEVVAVVGAGKIGLEFAEAFAARGLDVHVIESGPEVLPSFGADAGRVVAEHLRERDVALHLGTDVERLRENDAGRVTGIATGAGVIEVDAVVADLGVEPNTELAEAAGIELGPTGAVARDEYGRTNVPRVYAAGDCAEKHHLVAGAPVHWPFALAANRAGRAIGRSVAGTRTPVGGIVGTGVAKIFDLEVSRTGLLDAEARAAGYDPRSTTITTISRAHYYPGWARIVVHLVAAADTGRLLGGSIVGKEGAAHRINAIATALHAEMTVEQVGTLDFAYAPPFGPVWDPVLTAAKSLAGELEGPRR